MTLSAFAEAIGTTMSHVSNMTKDPKIIPTIKDNRKYIDIIKYPIEKFKKRGT